MPRTKEKPKLERAWTSRYEGRLLELAQTSKASVGAEGVAESPTQATGTPHLPTADGGSKAWLFMISAFLIEAILWGLPLTFGIFAAYYSNHPLFRNDRFIPVIGTLGTGIPFLGAPLITPLTARWHKYQRQMVWGGWITCIGSLIAASFATKVWMLIVTQGVAYGIGFLVLYYALLSMLNEWFVRRRGLAYGVLFAAAGLSGTGLPFLVQLMLDKFGYAATLRGYSVAMLVLIGPTLPLCRGRYSFSKSKPNTKVDWVILKNPVFWAFSFSNLFQGLGFYLPGIYLPSFASTLSITPAKATLLLCLLNGAQVIGQVALGWVSDWVNVFVLLIVSTLAPALLSGILWYLANSFTHLLVFTLLYGLFAGGYSVLWPRFITCLTDDSATSLWLYGLLAFQRGLGNIVAGPISVELFKMSTTPANTNQSAAYRGIILFVAISLVISSFGSLGWLSQRRSRKKFPMAETQT